MRVYAKAYAEALYVAIKTARMAVLGDTEPWPYGPKSANRNAQGRVTYGELSPRVFDT